MLERACALSLLALTACSKPEVSMASTVEANEPFALKCEGTNVLTNQGLPTKTEDVAILLRFRPAADATKGVNNTRPVELVQELKGMSALVGAVNWCRADDCKVEFNDTKIVHDADRSPHSAGHYRFEISRLTGDYRASADMGAIGLQTETGQCTPVNEGAPKF